MRYDNLEFLLRNPRIYRIVIAITIEVQAVSGAGIQISSSIGRDKSTPLGVIVAGVQVIQPGLPVVVVTAIANGVALGQVRTCAVGNGTIAPGVMYILPLFSPAVKKKPPRPRRPGWYMPDFTLLLPVRWFLIVHSPIHRHPRDHLPSIGTAHSLYNTPSIPAPEGPGIWDTDNSYPHWARNNKDCFPPPASASDTTLPAENRQKNQSEHRTFPVL